MSEHDAAECTCDELPIEPQRSDGDAALDEARAGLPISRRSIIAGVTLGAGLTTLPRPATAMPEGKRGRKYPPVRLVTLGTKAGPPVSAGQAGICSALVVEEDVYVIDAGRAGVTQYAEAGLRLDRLKAMFITHLHADHIADYYNFFLCGGHIPNAEGDRITRPTPIFGPGSAGGLPARSDGADAVTLNPEEPTPGLASMTQKLHAAYAYSTNVFRRDMGIPDITKLMDVREISLPAHLRANYLNPAPSTPGWKIYEDAKVRVTATLVPHGPVFPAFAFRFDTAYGSVTFSGDTTVTDNLTSLAQGTDILVHEVIGMFGPKLTPENQAHMNNSHVFVEQLGEVAARAEAKQLVISHYVYMGRTRREERLWREEIAKNYQRPVILAKDLGSYGLNRS